MKKYCFFFFITFLPSLLFSQVLVKKDTLLKEGFIKYDTNGNVLNFRPQVPLLQQIEGAPKAFYSYYWEFGDGTFSKEKAPKHVYKRKGDYEVKLWITNHYDVGKPPATRPQKVSVLKLSESVREQALMTDDFMLQKNREPVPNEEMVLIMSYKNNKNYITNGKLLLFYNEAKFKVNNFELTDVRSYHNEAKTTNFEEIVSVKDSNDNEKLYASIYNQIEEETIQIQDSLKTDLTKTIEESKKQYRNWSLFKFDELNPSDERNLFFTLKTTPEMLKDTSATISIRGVYIPDGNYKNHKVKEIEMEIVTSHDPNKMTSNGTFLNYRLVRLKTLKYKIQFQNNGEGPAKTIKLETDIPDMLDKSTLKIRDMYPKCKICPKEKVSYSCLDTTFTKKQVIFTFRNIYLPGSNQKGVRKKDSTKGFVKYSIKFSKDFHKKKTRSRTAIIFDKNKPIYTNKSVTRFVPGISVGAKSGYNYFSQLKNSKNYFVGVTISPYKSYRWYWQMEFLPSLHSYYLKAKVKEEIDDSQGVELLRRETIHAEYKNIDITIPVLARYNINNYIGVGVGVQGTISMSEKFKKNILTEETVNNRLINSFSKTENITTSFTNLRKGLLFDATVGFARIGPSVGARYIVNTGNQNNYWQFYAIWKF